jgi:hypothetical protein
MRIQPEVSVLSQYTDRVYAGIDTVAQWEINNPVLAAKCDCRFSYVCCKHAQSAALPAGKQHCDHFFFNHTITSVKK